jgi:hypothetical protein
MSAASARDEFIVAFVKARVCGEQAVHLAVADARLMLRYAATLQRLAEAQCNGDWPADNGQRETATCQSCDRSWVPVAMMRAPTLATANDDPPTTKYCPACRTTFRVRRLATAYGFMVQVGGDPRGLVVRLYPPHTAAIAIQTGIVRGLGVPA